MGSSSNAETEAESDAEAEGEAEATEDVASRRVLKAVLTPFRLFDSLLVMPCTFLMCRVRSLRNPKRAEHT